MKQDKDEAKAVASALPYGLRQLPVVDVPQVEYLAPDLLLPTRPKPAPHVDLVGPRQKDVPMNLPMGERARWRENKDYLVRKASGGIYRAIADAEWARIPLQWRKVIVLVGGIGDLNTDIDVLARRSWQEMPPPEREAVKAIVRDGYTVFGRTHSLRMRTVE